MTAPTPEQFLAETGTDEDDFDTEPVQLPDLHTPPTPDLALGSIATSLRMLVDIFTVGDQLVSTRDAEAADLHGEEIRLLGEAYDDLEAKHRSLYDLLADVEKIVKPSTSKLANSVRDAINAWRSPVIEDVPPAQPVDPAPPAVVNPAVQCGACTRYFADQELLERHACTAAQGLALPANDASVEVWREYARSLNASPTGEPAGLDSMNRSQIRTLLGLPHFEG